MSRRSGPRPLFETVFPGLTAWAYEFRAYGAYGIVQSRFLRWGRSSPSNALHRFRMWNALHFRGLHFSDPPAVFNLFHPQTNVTPKCI